MTTQKLHHWNLECEINLAGVAKSIGVTSGLTKAGSAASDRTRRQKKRKRRERLVSSSEETPTWRPSVYSLPQSLSFSFRLKLMLLPFNSRTWLAVLSPSKLQRRGSRKLIKDKNLFPISTYCRDLTHIVTYCWWRRTVIFFCTMWDLCLLHRSDRPHSPL